MTSLESSVLRENNQTNIDKFNDLRNKIVAQNKLRRNDIDDYANYLENLHKYKDAKIDDAPNSSANKNIDARSKN